MKLNKEKEKIEEEPETTKVIGNEMFFYSEVTPESILEFTEKFKILEIDLLKKAADLSDYKPSIKVNIMSEGGDMFAGLAAMNILEKSRVEVITVAQGSCCSAATFMFMGGKKRLIGRNAYMLIHQLSTDFWGKYEELKSEMKTCDKFMDMIKMIYTSRSKIPEKKLNKLMKKDLYLEPTKCVKYGIAHDID
jgi:ATP-dependent protease ClpP protease subunit